MLASSKRLFEVFGIEDNDLAQKQLENVLRALPFLRSQSPEDVYIILGGWKTHLEKTGCPVTPEELVRFFTETRPDLANHVRISKRFMNMFGQIMTLEYIDFTQIDYTHILG